jgi:hypothetical protein
MNLIITFLSFLFTHHPHSNSSPNRCSQYTNGSAPQCLPKLSFKSLLPALSDLLCVSCSHVNSVTLRLCTFSRILNTQITAVSFHCFAFSFLSQSAPSSSFAQGKCSTSQNMYFDIDHFFVYFLYPISVVLVSFHKNHVCHVSFPKLVVVIATWIVFSW